MYDIYDNDFDKAFDEAVDRLERQSTDDLISRKAALEAIEDIFYAVKDKGVGKAWQAVFELPTVELKTATEAIDGVDWYHLNADGEMVLGATSEQKAWFKADDVFKAIEAIEPKHGRWIYFEEIRAYSCSECHRYQYGNTLEGTVDDYKFCPNCGAKMDEAEPTRYDTTFGDGSPITYTEG